MNTGHLFNILGSIVVVAGIATLVAPGSQAANVIIAFGKAFAGSLTAAEGKG